MFNANGLTLGLTSVLPYADPDDPSPLIPGGPNFGLFAGLGGATQLIIGTGLAILFVVGLVLFLRGIGKFRVGNKDTGQGAKGISSVVSGVIIMVAAFIAIPIINLLIGVAQGAGSQI